MQTFSRLLAILVVSTLLGVCGCGGNSRQMQSIAIAPATISVPSGSQTPFTASAQFNAAPMNVNPAAVSWMIVGPGFDPAGPGYSLTAQPFNGICIGPSGTHYVVVAFAPVDPNAPPSSSMPAKVFNDLVMSHTMSTEDGFVATTAQMTCS
jgi:hypothetical protein